MPEDGGKPGVGSRAGAFTFVWFEEVLMVQVVQEVLVVGEDVWGSVWFILVDELGGTHAEDLLHFSLSGTGGLSPCLLHSLMV